MNKTKSNIFSHISMFEKLGKLMAEKESAFEELTIEQQTILLSNIILYFKTGRTVGCDISIIGGSKQSGTITINSKLNKNFCIIDQSPTGLFEKRSGNILEL